MGEVFGYVGKYSFSEFRVDTNSEVWFQLGVGCVI